MIVRHVLRHGARIAAGSLAVLAVVIVGSRDSALAAQTVTLTVPTTNLTRGHLQTSGATTSSAITDPGTTQTGGTFQAGTTGIEFLRVGMVIQILDTPAANSELMLITGLTEGGLSPDTITVNRGTVAGFSGAGVVAHATGKAILRNINFLPVNISNVTTESGGNLTVALDAAEFEASGARVAESLDGSNTLFRVDTSEPLYTGRTLLIQSEKMLIADGLDPDQVAVYPGWQLNSGGTVAVATDEHLVAGKCANAVDDDGDGKINDGCPAAGDFVVVAEAGAECNDAVDQNSFDTAGTGYEDDDGVAPSNEQFEDGDSAKVNDGCTNVESEIIISDQTKVNVGWKIKIDNEFMTITGVMELGTPDRMTVTRGVNSITASHAAGAVIWGGQDKVEVQRGYAGTTAAPHPFLTPIFENVRTLTLNASANVSEGSHFQIDSEKFTAITDVDGAFKVKAARAILTTSMAAHSSSAALTLIDGLGGSRVTIGYPTSHLDYTFVLPGAFLISTGRSAAEGTCVPTIDLPGSVEVLCVTPYEFPLGPFGTGAVIQVGFTALAITGGGTSAILSLSSPEAVDTSGDPYDALVTPTATIKINHCADFGTSGANPAPDFTINAFDIAIVRSKFSQPASANPLYDVNAHGINIDAADIGITRGQFGVRCYRP